MQSLQPWAIDTATQSISLTLGSSAPGAITSLTLSQVRRSVFGSCASARQKLLTKSDCRVLRMSSKTARASLESSSSESSFTVAMASSLVWCNAAGLIIRRSQALRQRRTFPVGQLRAELLSAQSRELDKEKR